jgi:hypothetical protein
MAANETDHSSGEREEIRKLAYALWESEGSPGGMADEYWRRAEEIRKAEKLVKNAV